MWTLLGPVTAVLLTVVPLCRDAWTMDDRAVTQLVDTLDEPSVRSLVLVPAESPASVHVRRNGRHGWVVELDCRGRLSHDLEAVVGHGSAATDPGTCELDVHSDARVHVTIRARERGAL